MGTFNAGLCSVSFRNHSPEEILQAMTAADLRFIEWGSDVHAPFDDEEKLNRIASLQKEYGITCSSYGTYFRIGETNTHELCSYIRAAEILGTNLIRLWCGTKGSAVHEPQEKAQLFAECRRIAQIAKEHGVTVAMECHQWTYTDTAESISELMMETASSNFRMYWQPNQYRTAEENLRHIEMTSEYVTAVHIFNWERDMRHPLSDAVDVWQKYLSHLHGEYPILLEFMPDDSIDSLLAEADALREIISGDSI